MLNTKTTSKEYLSLGFSIKEPSSETTTFKLANLKKSTKIMSKSCLSIICGFLIFSLFGCMSFSNSEPEKRNLLDLIDYLDHNKLKAEKIIPVRFQTLHASDGCILVINGIKTEVYIYDSSNKAQKKKLEKIKKNKSIQVLSLTVPVVVNGGMVMLVYSKDNKVSEIIKAFKAFPSDYKSQYNIKQKRN